MKHVLPVLYGVHVEGCCKYAYLTRDYYDRENVAGFGQFRHIFPEPYFPRSLMNPPIIIPSKVVI